MDDSFSFEMRGNLWMALYVYSRISIVKSQISMNHWKIRGTSTIRHPSYYRLTTSACIFFFIRSNYNRHALNPAYGQSGFRSVGRIK